ncbi:putative phytanoyl- dioxygenase family protein [Rosellinia necatrix]|uniref:Putative phytanoyl-dioxygenase family protein n=1 Tax=Rosellinia necatrix TaxID=77044 RepID=A0A1W2TRV3_ROSNE|nr:putative phytanoyl- dioxygenase family protein [Rosellinia necatrix]
MSHLHHQQEAARRVLFQLPGTLDKLKRLCEQEATPSNYTLASSIKSNVPHYDLSSVSCSDVDVVCRLQDEWYDVLSRGPGVLILQNFMTDQALLRETNKVFDIIIKKEASSAKGDHFATSGVNSRIWNSFQKHAVQDPASFVPYYSNLWLAKVSEAWLGPAYQVTAQVNIVRPGGKPQEAHRDFHLGFQSNEACAQFPRSMQIASQFLTLQGGVAHSEMPLESGPTRVLPFSQLLPEGYLAWREPEIRAFFNENWVSAPMKAGDAVFFNPALLHAAGENTTTDLHRSANLLQINSAFGRAMEHVNNIEMIGACWDTLKMLAAEDGEGERTKACVNALAEGYPFPSNLDKQQPGVNGMAPPSEIDVLWEGLRKGWDTDQVIIAVKTLKSDSTY